MTVENIIVILTFIFPGAFSKILLLKFANVQKRENSYIEICEYISVSFGVLILNFISIVVLNQMGVVELDWTNNTSIRDIASTNITIGFVIKYLGLTVINTCILTSLLWVFNRYLFSKITGNKINKKTNVYGYTLWESIFHAEVIEFKLAENPLIEIFKDGELLECGRVHSINGNPNKKPEFLLYHCNEMREYLDADKDNEIKLFDVFSSYCDIEEKIVVKIYNMDKYNAYVEDFNQQSNQ